MQIDAHAPMVIEVCQTTCYWMIQKLPNVPSGNFAVTQRNYPCHAIALAGFSDKYVLVKFIVDGVDVIKFHR